MKHHYFLILLTRFQDAIDILDENKYFLLY